jgi:hypothetical protein
MTQQTEKHIGTIKEYVYGNYRGMFRDAGGAVFGKDWLMSAIAPSRASSA